MRGGLRGRDSPDVLAISSGGGNYLRCPRFRATAILRLKSSSQADTSCNPRTR